MQTVESGSVVQVWADHNVSAGASAYMRDKVSRVLDHVPGPVISTRVRLTRHREWVASKPVVAQANVSLPGRMVRVQVSATSEHEAADLLEVRLKSRLDRLARHGDGPHGGRSAAAGSPWRHGDVARARLPYFPRPEEEREVVRHKAFTLAHATCDEAASDMELLDYDFQLFTEAGSGVDSVLYRTGSGGLRLAQLTPQPQEVIPGVVALSMSPAASPELALEGAITRLELTNWPFVFFRDRDTGSGSVLYHRYDGHYGLLTPAE
ncbi:sigma 54 modulation/S30EA ribosomal C-terminal domain-containing protein [Nocardia seriolae]|uniref:sigma 54 modulation/S30EA ribosomal C-terminal domain-containing protein n=1 Tax=Nocardia seriolae TaxID=37332 RepID=UPI0004AD9722|nr:conserved hypothetical protein [Nocardia seriolae]